MTWLAYLWEQQPHIILLFALAVFALVSWGLAVWQMGRVASIKVETFEDLRARARDKELAEMMGQEDARRAFEAMKQAPQHPK